MQPQNISSYGLKTGMGLPSTPQRAPPTRNLPCMQSPPSSPCELSCLPAFLQAIQYVAEHGEVCPANWKPGDKTMIADPDKSQEYFSTLKARIWYIHVCMCDPNHIVTFLWISDSYELSWKKVKRSCVGEKYENHTTKPSPSHTLLRLIWSWEHMPPHLKNRHSPWCSSNHIHLHSTSGWRWRGGHRGQAEAHQWRPRLWQAGGVRRSCGCRLLRSVSEFTSPPRDLCSLNELVLPPSLDSSRILLSQMTCFNHTYLP